MKIISIKILFAALIITSFLSTVVIAETNVSTITIYTDSSWKSFDTEVKGWTSINFDDSYWPEAKDKGGSFASLDEKARPIGYPEELSSTPFYFRKTFELSGTEIMSGKLYYNAYVPGYTMYARIYVNDNYVSTGKDIDIAPYLKIGKNVIAVESETSGGRYKDYEFALVAKIRVVSTPVSPSPTLTSTITPTILQPSAVSDTSPPSISISKQVVDFNKNAQLEEGEKLIITYGGNDESGVKSIKLLVDGNLVELRNNEGTYSVTTDSLSIGEHSIIVEAIDSKGNKKSEEMKVNVSRAGPSVYFPKSKYEVNEGEELNLVLSAVNPLGNPKMEALLILKLPSSGVSIYESDCKALAGMCTGKFEIVSGDNVKPISVRMRAERAGEYQIDAEVYYQFDTGQKSPTRYETLTLVVKPMPIQTPTAIATSAQKSTPGFGIIVSIIGILFLIFLKKRREKL